MITQCFDNDFISINIDLLHNSKELPDNVKISHKYNQIFMSIKEIGLIEPIVVFRSKESSNVLILDGHLRVEALKDLGITDAHCLVAHEDDTYTYNKRVSRLTIVQEQKMLRKAVDSGVSINKLSVVLGASSDTLIGRIKLFDGIAEEVVTLLGDKHVPRALFIVLRKMKFDRQVEVVSFMISLDNYSKKFALSLLHATPTEQLVNNERSILEKKDIRKNLERLEKEMASVQIATKDIQEHYAANNLKLVVIQKYIKKLLDNAPVLHWLLENQPVYLTELKKISEFNTLSHE
ncbi:plasmid partitioning protein RepB C-terminal domain-containing protein [Serratia fonticola]